MSDLNSKPSLTDLLDLRLPNGTLLRIVDEIGTKYEQFGILLLKDEFGKRVEIIKHDEQRVENIIIEILRKWLNGTGLKPAWGTILKVLEMMDMTDLADNIACSLNHMLQKNQHDEQ